MKIAFRPVFAVAFLLAIVIAGLLIPLKATYTGSKSTVAKQAVTKIESPRFAPRVAPSFADLVSQQETSKSSIAETKLQPTDRLDVAENTTGYRSTRIVLRS